MTNSITIGITGANGHIGSALTSHFTQRGFRVVGFVRKIQPDHNAVTRRYDLAESITDDLFTGIDVLIHCAYVSSHESKDAEQINYNGSKQLFDTCKKQGVKKIIFFSSVTATLNAKSGYAKSKFAIEHLLQPNDDFIINCSMVIGRGGLFQRLLSYATSHTFIPLIGSGKQVIQVVAIEDVVRFVEELIVRDLKGSGTLASEEVLTYKQFFSLIAKVYRKKLVFIPAPPLLLKIILKACRLMNIQTGASEENIVGMQTLSYRRPLLILTSYITLKTKLEELRDSSEAYM